jgi:hypothetical protein
MTDPWLQTFVEQYRAECPSCRRQLVAAGDQCPFCGLKYRLGLKVVEAYLLAWGATLGCLALNAGLGMFLLFLILHDMKLGGSFKEWVVFGVALEGTFSLVPVVLLLAFRKRFCSIARWLQWVGAAISAIVLVCAAGLFLVFLH